MWNQSTRWSPCLAPRDYVSSTLYKAPATQQTRYEVCYIPGDAYVANAIISGSQSLGGYMQHVGYVNICATVPVIWLALKSTGRAITGSSPARDVTLNV
jgi:hypothetical protein